MTNKSEYAPVECVNIPKILFQEKQYEKLSVDAKLWLMGRNKESNKIRKVIYDNLLHVRYNNEQEVHLNRHLRNLK